MPRARPARPPQPGELTPQAEQALQADLAAELGSLPATGGTGGDAADVLDQLRIENEPDAEEPAGPGGTNDTGDRPGRAPARRPAKTGGDDSKARSGPPTVGEWQDFFSRVLIRTATNLYLEAAFRGVDEDLLSDREVERIQLTETERDKIARPFAEFSSKAPFLRRHGRLIISAGGTSESLIALGAWVRRVNRIARKYKTAQVVTGHVSPRPDSPHPGPPVNGHVTAGYPPGQYYSPGG